MSARVVAVIQARMGSSRLPGKVLLPLGGHPVLAWVVRAARSAGQLDDVVVATSTELEDEAIVDACEQLDVKVVRGSELDVLSRFLLAANIANADSVVRLTADCPLLDPTLIDQVVSLWRADPALDYVSTTLVRSFPRGADVELATTSALKRIEATALGHDRVHVTSALYTSPSRFRRAGVVTAPRNDDLRVTLDVEDDYELLKELVALLPDQPPSWRTVVDTLRLRPDLVAINAEVQQKQLNEG